MKIITKLTNGVIPDNSKALIRSELSGKSGYVSIEIKEMPINLDNTLIISNLVA